ncbi:MAG: hypothetical protein HY693_01230 [Deltaproteobacteria bacterium]|nr:hypothetical protein [Deltaproteobacteria bacterium]
MERVNARIEGYVSPSVPREKRLMAAKGHVVALKKELVLILYILVGDSDQEISKQSEETLKSLPEDTIASVLSDEMTPPELLDYFARSSSDMNQIKAIILNPSTSDTTIEHIAKTVRNQNLLDVIINNKERMLRSEDIVEALCSNPSLNRSTVDELISYVGLYLMDEDKIPDLLKEEPAVASSDNDQESVKSYDKQLIDFSSSIVSDSQDTFLDRIELSEDLIKETDEETTEKNRDTLFNKIREMNFSERLKLSILGNREARSLLIRDPNKIVACSVLRNPRLTESEVLLFAQSKVVDDEVLRAIAETRKWIRLYQIKYNLVSNPKTPSHISLNFMRYIRDRDLRSIMNDKNIPGVITAAAARVIKERVKRSN